MAIRWSHDRRRAAAIRQLAKNHLADARHQPENACLDYMINYSELQWQHALFRNLFQAMEALPLELRTAAALPSGPLPLEMQADM